MRYRTGKKSDMLRLMAEYAIRDQETLITALTPEFQDPDVSASTAIDHARDCIRDFRAFIKTLL